MQIVEVSWLGTREVIDHTLDRMGAGGAVVTVSSIASMGWRWRTDVLKELVAIADRDEARAWIDAHPEQLGDGYCLAKECVVVYTVERSVELAGRGIRINCTSPGDTETGMSDAFVAHFGEEAWASLPRPLGRMAAPEEQAAVLLFLNSERGELHRGRQPRGRRRGHSGHGRGRLAPCRARMTGVRPVGHRLARAVRSSRRVSTIGAAIARHVRGAGSDLVLVARGVRRARRDRGADRRRVAHASGDHGRGRRLGAGDVYARGAALDEFGVVDTVVNNAGHHGHAGARARRRRRHVRGVVPTNVSRRSGSSRRSCRHGQVGRGGSVINAAVGAGFAPGAAYAALRREQGRAAG